MNKAAIAIALLSLLTGCEPLQPAKESEAQLQVAAKDEASTKAATSVETLAAQGDAVAQVKLAKMYFDGTGVAQDYVKAADLYEKSAKQGNAQAQYQLGLMYYEGNIHGIEQDYIKAYEWLVRAAQQQHPEASHYMAEMFRQGEGVIQDDDKAKKWFERACKAGYRADCSAVEPEDVSTASTVGASAPTVSDVTLTGVTIPAS